MTQEEAKKAIEELRTQGATDENIVAAMYMMFRDGNIDVNQLADLVKLVGYELTDEFMNMSPEEQKTKFFEDELNTEIPDDHPAIKKILQGIKALRKEGFVDEEILAKINDILK